MNNIKGKIQYQALQVADAVPIYVELGSALFKAGVGIAADGFSYLVSSMKHDSNYIVDPKMATPPIVRPANQQPAKHGQQINKQAKGGVGKAKIKTESEPEVKYEGLKGGRVD